MLSAVLDGINCIRFRVFVIFSTIPHGIWKIYFDMFSYISKLSRNHSRSMLNFFPVWTPTLNCVIRKKIVLIKWLELIFNGRWSEIHLGFDQKKFDPHILHPKQLQHEKINVFSFLDPPLQAIGWAVGIDLGRKSVKTR